MKWKFEMCRIKSKKKAKAEIKSVGYQNWKG